MLVECWIIQKNYSITTKLKILNLFLFKLIFPFSGENEENTTESADESAEIKVFR